MRLVSFLRDGSETCGVRFGRKIVPIHCINELYKTNYATTAFELINEGQLDDMRERTTALEPDVISAGLSLDEVQLAPLYREPRKIWGIGLNYREHAGDLHAIHPTEEPASFMKADTTLIGPGDSIYLPPQSSRVTAEAEIAVIMGRTCRNVAPDEALSYVAGFVAVIDMTAEDILQRNPRFLTRSKNFDTFFSFGSELVTPDEIPQLADVQVGTYANDVLHRENVVRNMTFSPEYLVAFHSSVFTWLPGDILCTGTPGAVVIEAGDTAACRIDGFMLLANPVVR